MENKSTFNAFLQWLEECGNDLFVYDELLSCSGSDGPDISEDGLDGIPFSCPEAIEEYLIEEGYYEKHINRMRKKMIILIEAGKTLDKIKQLMIKISVN